MSRTLFWYILWDLLRIFFMASGALAGIMSFGGLLRPLTSHGLSAAQVGRMLTYLTPAMTTYSFPVAAVFAATIVYGRLSADNELTACRSSGISYLSMTTPALVLGLSVSIASLLFLCFVVPFFSLQVEKTIYSNLAQLVQNEIEQNHEVELDDINVYARSARLLGADPRRPTDQRVELIGPMIVTYPSGGSSIDRHTPSAFWLASRADVYLRPRANTVELQAVLRDGCRFARDLTSGYQVNAVETQFGPVTLSSPIREEAKFMDIRKLKELINFPERSRRLQDQVHGLVRQEMSRAFLAQGRQALNSTGRWRFESEHEAFVITRGEEPAVLSNDQQSLIVRSQPEPDARQVRLEKELGHRVESTRLAREMRIDVDPRYGSDESGALDPPRLIVAVSAFDVLIETEAEQANHRVARAQLSIPMPADILAMRTHSIDYFLTNRITRDSPAVQLLALTRDRMTAKITSEIHGRTSFAVSCLVLVLVGCALGMMFKSGNFLSAFAVSFIPAMLTVALIVTGQQVWGNNPNSSGIGMAFIWGSNLMVLLLAVSLLGRLQTQ